MKKPKIETCAGCKKPKYCPIQLTEVKDGGAETFKFCEKCGKELYKGTPLEEEEPVKQPQKVDLSEIKTPEELLMFLTNHQKGKKDKGMPPCECGMSEADFDKYGKFGCPKCYTHFAKKLDELVFPYHGASEHKGKRPKKWEAERWMNDPVEKEKVLKLRYAKAVELEQYEKAAEIKKLLDELRKSKSETC